MIANWHSVSRYEIKNAEPLKGAKVDKSWKI